MRRTESQHWHSMSRNRKTSPAEQPWWEKTGKLAGAILAMSAVAGAVIGFVSPRPSIAISITEGSWKLIGKEGERYRYTVELVAKNHGNRPIVMTPRERKLLRVCSGTPLRPGDKRPAVEIIRNESSDLTMLVAESMQNNVLQLGVHGLRVPFISSARVQIELLSPIYDLGGISLLPMDNLFDVQEIYRPKDGTCVND